MASIIDGYSYDIFISYRQKDNKGDKWVSKFVEALKTELEAAFKEDVSVYFDENPHDRLQETHNVDKSLEGKLKCLIFIPVLSQTYCDPNSYAWQYEFLAFLRMAANDRFGKDIKLRSGNVASRILPIRIHDLEQEDVKLFEKEIGSILRAMDFVFKTASGVNRPLKANEDHPQDNLNKIFYSDQINKVAHAIKEIILGMKTEPVSVVKEKTQYREPLEEVYGEEKKIEKEKPAKLNKLKILSGVAILTVLIIIAILDYPKILKRDKLSNMRSSDGRISVAVMPFQNMTNDTIWNVWQGGIQNMLITSLSNSEELKVRQIESITSLLNSKGFTNYASITPSVASTISQKLQASVFIYGSINQAGSTIRLNAQLIDSKTEEIFKSFQIEEPAKEENIFHIIDSVSILVKNYLIISILEKKLGKEKTNDIYMKGFTNSPEAYRYFIYGMNAFLKDREYTTARNWYLRAIEKDSNFISASYWIMGTFYNQGIYDQAKKWCSKVYEKGDKMPMPQQLMINDVYAILFKTPNESITWLRQLLEIDDQQPTTYYILGFRYLSLYQYDKAIPEFKKTLEIYDKWDSKTPWAPIYPQLGYAYHKTGQYKEEEKLYKKAEQDFPDDPDIIYRQAILSLTEQDTIAANRYIEKYKSIRKEKSTSEAAIFTSLAGIYSEASILDKAEEYYKEALSLEPKNRVRINNLAYFLIDKDRDISKGLELADTLLRLSPDNYNYLHCKGWGLYKQGKYQEGHEILQKSWDLRMQKSIYNHTAFLHLEEAKKAVAGLK
jgi:tetratricopeptide (TPR) repeat protein